MASRTLRGNGVREQIADIQTAPESRGKLSTVPPHQREFRQEAALLLEVGLEAVGQIRTARAKEKEDLDQIEFSLFGPEDPWHQDCCP